MTATATIVTVSTGKPAPRGRVATGITRHLIWLPLALIILWSAVPLVWSIASSFKSQQDFALSPPPFFPTQPTTAAYETVLTDPQFWLFSWNSLVLAVVSTIFAIIISTLAAYGFARYAFAWRHVLLLFFLVPKLVPRVSLISPIYELVQAAGMLDTRTALIIVYTGMALPLSTWIMIGFIGSIPPALDEAARIDGASTFQVFLRIIVPLSIPGLLTIAVMSFSSAWNEFPFVLALTSSPEIRTLPYQLFLLNDSVGIADYAVIQAFALLTIIPIVLIYIRLEKYVVGGLVSGATK
jgi:ABC-type glycerol-3-phosphate transport system permease component